MAAQHFYVTKTGNDANDGSSWADGDAWLTIQHAADNANPAGGTPITIHIASGTYAEQVDIDTYAGTDDDNRIIFDGDIENESGDGATRPIIDGGNIRTHCLLSKKNYITFQDIDFYNAAVTNVRFLDAFYGIVERCIVRYAVYIGIQLQITTVSDAYSIVRNCIIYDNGRSGSSVNHPGVAIVDGGYEKIYNNTIVHNYAGVRLQYNNEGGHNVTIKNNVIHDNTTNQIDVATGMTSGLVSDYNDLYADNGTRCGTYEATTCATLSDWQTASSQDANGQEGDPLYVNEAGDDFHITDNASPCYQNGTDLSGTFTIDYDQDTRVHWDIGADYIATAGYTISIGSGSFIETGQTVSLLKENKVAIGAGSFDWTGVAVTLAKGRIFSVLAGTFVVTGSSVTLLQKDGDYTIPRPVETAYVELIKPTTLYTELW